MNSGDKVDLMKAAKLVILCFLVNFILSNK